MDIMNEMKINRDSRLRSAYIYLMYVRFLHPPIGEKISIEGKRKGFLTRNSTYDRDLPDRKQIKSLFITATQN